MTDCDVIVDWVCRLPRSFRQDGAKSVIRLAEEIGLPEYRRCITQSAIQRELSAQPALVDDWLRWSGDKRTSSGWYFSADGADIVVGFYPNGQEERFTDRISACTQFVIYEIEDLIAEMTG